MLKPAARSGPRFLNPVPTSVGDLRTILKLIPLYFRNREERVPHRQLGPFHTDASVYAQPPGTGLRVTWFGHSTLLIELDGVRLMTDPIWDERASPVSWAGPRRFYPPTLPLEQLPPIDAVLISHDHYDHLGSRSVRAIAALPAVQGADWVTSLGVGAILQEFGVHPSRVTELDWTGSHTVTSRQTGASVTVSALPARHFSGRSMRNRFHTLWSSFALRGAKHNVYYGADSGYWEGFRDIDLEYGPFDLTMLEIGAWNENWSDIHMGPDGAAAAFAAMGRAGLLMPIHWGLFDLALHGWRWPIERITELADRDGIALWSPAPGEPTEVVAGTPLRSRWWVRQE